MGQGPLSGLKVVEFAGEGPGPFCGMMLSDMGADVVRIDGRGRVRSGPGEVLFRGRRSVELDLKQPAAVEACLRLMDQADALIEGYRPGVMERLGLGPDVALARNPKLVYGRMTGWGQAGPEAQAAGHDINFIALTGALHAIGSAGQPVAPLNLVGDFGGGGLYLAFGLMAGVIHARATGQGQVIDCAMVDGAASLMAMFYGWKGVGFWRDQRDANLLDGGAHFYGVYECADGGWITLGAVEAPFYAEMLRRLGLEEPAFGGQFDRARWPALKARIAEVVRTRTRDEWRAVFEGSDACFAPVLSMEEAPSHPHNLARGTFIERDGVVQPAPAPRFSATPGAVQGPPPAVGAHTAEVLAEWGLSAGEIAALAPNPA